MKDYLWYLILIILLTVMWLAPHRDTPAEYSTGVAYEQAD